MGKAQFYGAVTVSDRGQVVIPAQARRDLDIEVGQKMLVAGGPSGGILFIKADILSQMLIQWADLIRELQLDEELQRPSAEDLPEGV